jgi:hypothetical protein
VQAFAPLTIHRRNILLIATAVALLLGGCSFLGIGRSSKPSIPARTDSVFHLSVGDCIVPPTSIQAEISKLKVVPCHEPHTQEVFALISDNAGSNYPGASALQTFANAGCLQKFQGYVGIAYEDSSLFYTYLLPSVRSWTSEDRTVDCIITTTGQPLTKSVRGSKH